MSDLANAQQQARDVLSDRQTGEVTADDLRGLSDAEQFLRVFSAPRAGTRLWEQWYGAANDTTRGVLDHLAAQTAEANNTTLDEARRALAAEKLLNDLGPDFAVRAMRAYRAERFNETRTLRPMAPRSKKK